MRAYILTEKERKILETFLNSGTRLEGFYVLLNRFKKAKSRLQKDLYLLMKTLGEGEG